MTIEYDHFKKLLARVYMAYFIRHDVSKYQTFDEALPFVRRTVNAWTIKEFEDFVSQLEQRHETHHRITVCACA